LQTGPLLTTMTVYTDFMFYTSGVYKHVTGDVEGGHAVVIVGYNDADQAFIVRNSWGPEWGEGGYFRIAYTDVSGVGRSNYAITLADPDFVKVGNPAHRQVLSGPISMQALNPRAARLQTIRYQLKSTTGARSAREGAFDASTLTAPVNTGELEDGVYELKAFADVAGGGASHPWYSLVTIANQPQNVTIKAEPDFDASKPVSDKIYWNFTAAGGTVPLTQAVLTIEKPDGTVARVSTFEDPGTESRMGLRTQMLPNGTYNVHVHATIGDLAAFDSAVTTINVKN
jgi:hypothetical protein